MSAEMMATGSVSRIAQSAGDPAAAQMHRQARDVAKTVEDHQAKQVAKSQQAVDKKVEQATDQLNKVMETFNKGIRFRVHEGTDRTFVQVINKQTDEVLREWPPEEMLDVMARLHEVIGMMLDRQG